MTTATQTVTNRVGAGTVTSPRLAVSMHAWDAYYVNPGAREVMSDRFRAHLDALARLNTMTPGTIDRVRIDMGWSASHPVSGPPRTSHYYNQRFIKLCAAIEQRGIRPYLVVHQSPAHARPGGTPVKHFPDDLHALSEWAAWFATTYGRWVREVQVWNEPNLEAFAGAGQNTPEKYVAVLKAFAAGVRSVDSGLKIIGGNVSQSDWWWLHRAYEAGMGEHCDIVGIHPYQGRQSIPATSVNISGLAKTVTGWERGRISKGIPKVVETMARFGDATKALWACEVGWSASATGVGTEGIGSRWPNLPAKAADYQRQMHTMFTECLDDGGPQAAYGKLRLVTTYQAFDPQSKDSHQKGFEILHAAGSLRPQARALAAHRAKYPAVRPLY